MSGTARTRSQGDIGIAARGFSWTVPAGPRTSSSCPAYLASGGSITRQAYGITGQTMADYLHSRDADGFLPQGDVDHVKVSNNLTPVQPWYQTACMRPAYPLSGSLPLMEATSVVQPLLAPPTNAQLNDLCDRAFSTFNTQFPEEVSIANFLWELREIAALLPRLNRGLIKAAANAHLSIEFGWKPLIGDLRAMWNVLERVDDRINYLRSRYGKLTRLGFSETIPIPDLGTKEGLAIGGSLKFRHIRRVAECRFTAGGELFHTLDWLFDTQGTVRSLMGAFGFSNPAKIIWNAIPYSFVIDWVADVSQLLTRYANLQDRSNDWLIRRLSWSYKLRYEIDVSQVCRPNGTTIYEVIPLGTYTYRRYYRRKGLSAPSAFALDEPTPRQFILLAAMITGKSN